MRRRKITLTLPLSSELVALYARAWYDADMAENPALIQPPYASVRSIYEAGTRARFDAFAAAIVAGDAS